MTKNATVLDTDTTTDTTYPYGRLVDYATGDVICAATSEEAEASDEAAELDGGSGVITVGGRSCYVEL